MKIADFGIAKLVGRAERRTEGEAGAESPHPSPLPTNLRSVPGEGTAATPQLTVTGQIIGTPQYMAPEQIEHPLRVDHRADIYSLGVVFYQMLTGELPIGRFAPPSRKVQLDVRLDEVVLRALEKKPERRYQQASEIKTRVETIAATPLGRSARTAAADDSREQALRQVRGPATGLLIAGILNWVVLVSFLIAMMMFANLGTAPMPHNAFQRNPSAKLAVVPVLALLGVVFGTSIVIIVAGLKMKRLQAYWLAVVVSSLVIILSPSNLVGLPIGIWALVVLSQQEVRAAFAETRRLKPGRRGPPPTRGERTVGILALIFCLQGVPLIWLAMVRGWGWSVWSFLAVVFSVILIAFLSGFLGRKSRTGKAAIIISSLYLLVALMFLGIVVYSKAIQPLYNFGGGASVERVPAGEPTRPVATVQQPGRPWRTELPSGVTVELLGVGKDDNTSLVEARRLAVGGTALRVDEPTLAGGQRPGQPCVLRQRQDRPAEPIGMTYEVTPSIYSHFTGSVKQHGKEVRNFVDFMVFDALLSGTVDTVAVRSASVPVPGASL